MSLIIAIIKAYCLLSVFDRFLVNRELPGLMSIVFLIIICILRYNLKMLNSASLGFEIFTRSNNTELEVT